MMALAETLPVPNAPKEESVKQPSATVPAAEDANMPDRQWILPAALLAVLLLTLFIIFRKIARIRRRRQIRKRREAGRTAVVEKSVQLSDDNSPQEYI